MPPLPLNGYIFALKYLDLSWPKRLYCILAKNEAAIRYCLTESKKEACTLEEAIGQKGKKVKVG